jgi:hypothetical protein
MRVAFQLWRGLALAAVAGLLVTAAAAPASAAAAKRCGGSIGVSCGPDQYCKRSVGACRLIGGTGVCVRKPQICSEIYDPVCGCDSHTYSNACEAAAAGANIVHNGKCQPPK